MNKRGRKELTYSRVNTSLINIEEIMELGKITITVIIDSVKNHQWMLKLVGESLTRNRIYT